jgi:flavin reductase (DIM6/NTAB) family NADH-FMN oxidoreductase RutF
MNEAALFSISCGLYVVGSQYADGLSGCIVDAFVQSTAVPPTVILCSQKHTFTHTCIQETGTFSVSVLRKDVDPLTIALFGFQSTRTVQKWQLVSHVLRSGLPVLSDAAAWCTCRVKQALDLGTHTMYHCDVMDAQEGQGEALTYGYYREHLRLATTAAFQAYRLEKKGEIKK